MLHPMHPDWGKFVANMNKHVSGAPKHEACPACRKRGNDTRGDNLGRYNDGHGWCFSCGYYEPPDTEKAMFQAFKAAPDWRKDEYEYDDNFLMFPDDYTRYIPSLGLNWLNQYGLSGSEIVRHRFGWSEKISRLVMPVFDKDNKILMWQGRAFGRKPKYLTRGPKDDIIHVVFPSDWDHLKEASHGIMEVVLTEGLLDAIKVARVTPAIPLWGSRAPSKMLRTLATRFERIGIWLDPDKTADAVRTALRASQWCPAYVVTSSQDPKCYDEGQVHMLLDQCGKELFKSTDPKPI